jgi:hypothetical protein
MSSSPVSAIASVSPEFTASMMRVNAALLVVGSAVDM